MTQTFSPLQLDAFRELGNIGSGNAATSLSVLLKRPVDLEVSQVEVVSTQLVYEKFGFGEDQTYSIIHPLTQDLDGLFWFVINRTDEATLCQYAAGDMEIDNASILQEISNILGGTYLAALSQMLNINPYLGTPYNMGLHHYLALPEHQAQHLTLRDSQSLLLIQNRLVIDDKPFNCFLSLLLENTSLSKVLQCLGV